MDAKEVLDLLAQAKRFLDDDDFSSAKNILMPLAEHDVPEAILMLGGLSNDDETEEAFEARYVASTERAAALNHPRGVYQLGVLYDTGDCGCEYDPEQASKLFKQAADLGHAHSQWIHACDVIWGSSAFDKDETKGVALMHQAVANGSAEACMTVAKWYAEGLYGCVQDVAKRDLLRRKALLLDDTTFDPWADAEE